MGVRVPRSEEERRAIRSWIEKPPVSWEAPDTFNQVYVLGAPVSPADPLKSQPPISVVSEPPGGPEAPLKGKLDIAEDKVTRVLVSKPAIFLLVFLFFYLVVFAGIGVLIGKPDLVSTQIQLALGNYTNVTSALGASIAAAAGVTVMRHQSHLGKLHREAKEQAAAHHAEMKAQAELHHQEILRAIKGK